MSDIYHEKDNSIGGYIYQEICMILPATVGPGNWRKGEIKYEIKYHRGRAAKEA